MIGANPHLDIATLRPAPEVRRRHVDAGCIQPIDKVVA
jgi:hypothetical protein